MNQNERLEDRTAPFSSKKETFLVFSVTFLLLFPSGQHSHEGAEHKTTGGVHVQRAEEAGLRRGLPLALPVHRLKAAEPRPTHTDTTTTTKTTTKGGAKSNRSKTPTVYHQYHHTQPHVWLIEPPPSEKPVQLDPNRLLLVEHLVPHLQHPYLYAHIHICFRLSFFF